MTKKIYILGIVILIFGLNAYFLNQKNITNSLTDSQETHAKNGIYETALSGKEGIAAQNSKPPVNYLGEEFTLAAFEQAHPPLNEDAPNWANILLEGYSLEAALSYSKKILSQNKNHFAIEALPVMLTAFKELNQTGQLEYFLVTTIDNLAQEKNADNDQKIYDLAVNSLRSVSHSEAYSVKERMALYKALQSDHMPDEVKRAAIDFQNSLMRDCQEYSCEDSS